MLCTDALFSPFFWRKNKIWQICRPWWFVLILVHTGSECVIFSICLNVCYDVDLFFFLYYFAGIRIFFLVVFSRCILLWFYWIYFHLFIWRFCVCGVLWNVECQKFGGFVLFIYGDMVPNVCFLKNAAKILMFGFFSFPC